MYMNEHENYIEIDLDTIDRYLEYLKLEDELTTEYEHCIQKCVESMRSALDSENYETAYRIAKKLEESSAFSNSVEIEECYKICAEHDVVEALIYEMEQYIDKKRKTVEPEAFPYLYKLAGLGYIKSFRWLADCYKYGIGCGYDCEKAKRLYFEGMLFDNDEYCRKKYAELYLEIEEYSGNDKLINAIKIIVCSINKNKADYKRTEIAELILEGKLAEYRPESACALLNNIDGTFNGMTDYLLGQCLLYGIGTKINPVVAKCLFEDAIFYFSLILKRWDDNCSETNYLKSLSIKKEDYLSAYDEAILLLEEAKRAENVFDDLTEDIAFEEWYKAEPLFIKRAENYSLDDILKKGLVSV